MEIGIWYEYKRWKWSEIASKYADS
jgi:hypothetical protein